MDHSVPFPDPRAGGAVGSDSKLTLILRNSLGGNTKTSLLLACSPHTDNEAETTSTLRFGERAKKIKTRVKANTQRSAAQLEVIVAKLTDEVEKLQAYIGVLEKKLEGGGIALPAKPSTADLADSQDLSVSGGGRDIEEMAVASERLQTLEEEKLGLLGDLKAEQEAAREAEAAMAMAQDALG